MGIIGFGRDARLLAPLSDPRLVGHFGDGADAGATNIAGALTAAESLFAPEADKRIVLLSDGNETEDSAMTEVPAMVEDGVRIFAAAPPPSATERIAVTNFFAPESVRADQRFAFRIDVESESQSPVAANLKLYSDDNAVGGQSITLKPGLNRFELPYRLGQPGAYLMSAEVSIAPPRVALNPRVEAPITVTGAPRILIVSATHSGQPGERTQAAQVPDCFRGAAQPERASRGLSAVSARDPRRRARGYDVARGAACAQSLRRRLRRRAGRDGDTLREESLAGGDLEKALPVKFVPQPPPPSREPIAVYLCIDRSNSMSYDSRYPAVRDGERIRYAKEAAIALLRQLDDTDIAGVIAFDSQPYVLAHLQPLGEDRTELENRIDRLQPGGGTDFKDALEIAEREILESGIPVRQVILLTDGDTNRQYHDHDDLIAEFARQHIPVSTIRIGPDLENLELLQDFAKATGGSFYRVQDIEKLPLLLVGLTRQAMNRRKSDRTTVEAGEATAMLSGIGINEIPPIDFFATTEAKDGAQVPLKVSRADKTSPLVAAWQYGLGRTAIFSADPDSLATLSWIRWNRYVEFWSQLANWTMRQGDSGTFTMRVHGAPDGSIAVEAEKADPEPVSNLVCRITGPGRAVDVAMTEADASIYRGEIGPLPRGKYTATLMFKAGDTEKVLEQREFAAAGSIPADSAELRIKPPNLELLRRLATATHGAFDASPATIARHSGQTIAFRRSADSWLIPLVIMLFLGEVFVRRRYLGD